MNRKQQFINVTCYSDNLRILAGMQNEGYDGLNLMIQAIQMVAMRWNSKCIMKCTSNFPEPFKARQCAMNAFEAFGVHSHRLHARALI